MIDINEDLLTRDETEEVDSGIVGTGIAP